MSDARTLARLEAVETRLMLRDLVSRYAYSVDNRAIDTLADLFAEDAVFRARNGGFSASGRTAIAAEFRSQLNGLGPSRSEEHTSELQSLMRISYAVFCLKKKIMHTHNFLPVWFNLSI